MITLKESLFDEEKNMEKIENDTHTKSISKTIKKYRNYSYDECIDRFGRELKVGDVVYNTQYNYIGVITEIINPGKVFDFEVVMKNLTSDSIIKPSGANNHVLIPKSCTKEFIKIITSKK